MGALPNFLNQTKKARLTEATQQIASGLRTAAGLYHEGTLKVGTTCGEIGVTDSADWKYTCTGTTSTMKISAAGIKDRPTEDVGSGDWSVDGTTGAITKGTPTGL